MNNPAWKDTESQEKILGNSVLPDPFDEPLPDPNAILSVLRTADPSQIAPNVPGWP